MATLIVKVLPEKSVRLSKSVTSIGRGPQNDVRIQDGAVEERHAHVLKDRQGFRIFASEGATVLVNGKRRSEWPLADGDRIDVGGIELVYHTSDAPAAEETTDPAVPVLRAQAPARVPSAPVMTQAPARPSSSPSSSSPRIDRRASERSLSITGTVPLEALKRLYVFSAKINESPTFDALKRNLVDAVIQLADADTGFMLLVRPDGSISIDVARDRRGNDLPAHESKLSDSIVADVIKRREPRLISDALEDSIFGESLSVVSYKLRSVIAVPIIRGEETLGVLYLGCDRMPSAFSPDFLDILMVFSAQAGLLVKNALAMNVLREDNKALKEALEKQAFGELVGGSTSMQGVFRAVARFAPAEISALIVGETGTGKELIAREIHRRSSRAKGPFVAINMSAIPENLLEAELFGHVKGAFTGATGDRRGKFAEANGGTLFLDEIGDMPLALQAKLLRVLQERMIEQVGSNKKTPIDIRLVSATNRDLKQAQSEGSFRPDLYFRLNEVQVVLPPLRERGDDAVLLARYFLTKYGEQMNRNVHRFTARAMAALKRYAWPGNVRELEAKVKKAIVMCEGHEIDVADLELEESQMQGILPLKEAKEVYAARYIREVLELNGGNRSKTARDLGIDPRTVYKYLEGK
ncbi:sigma 54-interacting transcriptional regulator [Myxococcota bacterium]|nr:sigma 54-interacting transcriptional regulator [Myxococcota bacterium]